MPLLIQPSGASTKEQFRAKTDSTESSYIKEDRVSVRSAPLTRQGQSGTLLNSGRIWQRSKRNSSTSSYPFILRTSNADYSGESASDVDYFNRLSSDDLLEKRIISEILDALMESSVEDGYSHPAESIIEQHIKNFGSLAIEHIQNLFLKNLSSNPSVASDLLRCIGRLDKSLVGSNGIMLIHIGLAQPNVELKDAALRLVEEWEVTSLRATLEYFIETEKILWLKQYAINILDLLGG